MVLSLGACSKREAVVKGTMLRAQILRGEVPPAAQAAATALEERPTTLAHHSPHPFLFHRDGVRSSRVVHARDIPAQHARYATVLDQYTWDEAGSRRQTDLQLRRGSLRLMQQIDRLPSRPATPGHAKLRIDPNIQCNAPVGRHICLG